MLAKKDIKRLFFELKILNCDQWLQKKCIAPPTRMIPELIQVSLIFTICVP